jgi:hypothetical protein
MCSAAITVTAWNLLWGHLSDQLHRAAGGARLGLQLGDAALGHRQLTLLGAGQPWLKTAVDPVLAAPGVDRLGADPQRLGDLGERPAGVDQIQDLAAKLRRIAPSSHATLLSGLVCV